MNKFITLLFALLLAGSSTTLHGRSTTDGDEAGFNPDADKSGFHFFDPTPLEM